MKYLTYDIVFQEIPDEVTLAINISNCPYHCEGCHTPDLRKDFGVTLTNDILDEMILANTGITCVAFMGGDRDPQLINMFAEHVKEWETENNEYMKSAWYSGNIMLPDTKIDLNNFDYIKLGPYIKELGGLDNPMTNQRLYRVIDSNLEDITYLMWKGD